MSGKFDRTQVQGQLGNRLLDDPGGELRSEYENYFKDKNKEIKKLLSTPLPRNEFEILQSLAVCTERAAAIIEESWNRMHRNS